MPAQAVPDDFGIRIRLSACATVFTRGSAH